MNEKSITRQQLGRFRRQKRAVGTPFDLAGACSGRKFVVSRTGEAYDPRNRGPNRKSWLKTTTRPDFAIRAKSLCAGMERCCVMNGHDVQAKSPLARKEIMSLLRFSAPLEEEESERPC